MFGGVALTLHQVIHDVLGVSVVSDVLHIRVLVPIDIRNMWVGYFTWLHAVTYFQQAANGVVRQESWDSAGDQTAGALMS